MPGPDDTLSGLPDTLRNSNRPIVIYQGGPPQHLDAPTSNALGLLSWLALITLCLGVVVFCAWSVWNPGHNQRQFSPIYTEGRPIGLAKQIEERRQVNDRAEGLIEFLGRVRANNFARRRAVLTHPLLTDREGLDELRQQWDAMCRNNRARIYDRRIGQIEARAAELRQRRWQTRDAAERGRIGDDLQSQQRQRNDEIERQRTDSDASLRCTPAAQAAVCSDSNDDAWCNPQLKQPREFIAEVP